MMLYSILVAVLLFNSIESRAFPEEGKGKLHIVKEETLPNGEEVVDYSYEASSVVDEDINQQNALAEKLEAEAEAKIKEGKKEEAAKLSKEALSARILAKAEQVEKLGWELLNKKKSDASGESCEPTAITKTAGDLKNFFSKAILNVKGAVNDLMDNGAALDGAGAGVDTLAEGASNALLHGLEAIDLGVKGTSCGLGKAAKIFDKALESGDLVNGAVNIAKELAGTFGDTFSNVASEVTNGAGEAASAALTVGGAVADDVGHAVHHALNGLHDVVDHAFNFLTSLL